MECTAKYKPCLSKMSTFLVMNDILYSMCLAPDTVFNTVHYTVQHYTVFYSTAQYSTLLYRTVQHITVHHVTSHYRTQR